MFAYLMHCRSANAYPLDTGDRLFATKLPPQGLQVLKPQNK